MDTLERATGQASIAGSVIYTVPAGATLTLVGLRAANTEAGVNHAFHVEINGSLVTGIDTPLPAGSALDAMSGSKIVAMAGDVITAFADADAVVDVYLSFLKQA